MLAGKTILLVEDDAITALMEKQELEQQDIRVIHAFNGEDALVKFADHDVDLVLMDIDLGKGIDGTETARQILNKRNLPLLFLSSHTEKCIVEKTEEITSYGYVVKNSGTVVLLASIKMAFRLFEARTVTESQQEKLGTILNCIGDACIATDADSLIIEFNPVAEKLTGCSRKDAIGRPIDEIVSLREAGAPNPMVNPVHAVMRHGNPVFLRENTELIGRNGSVFRIGDATTALRNSRNEIIGSVFIFRDTSREADFNRKLHESEEKFRAAFGNSPAFQVLQDSGHRILEANRAVCETLGFSNDEMIGKTPAELGIQTPEEMAGLDAMLKETGGHISHRELTIRRRDGSLLPVIFSMEEIMLSGGIFRLSTGIDISQWKSAREAQKASEQKYSLLFRETEIPAILTKMPERTFADLNPAFEKLFGYRKEDVLGKTSVEIGMIGPESQMRVAGVLLEGGSVNGELRRVKTAAGEEKIVQLRIHPIQLDTGLHAFTTLEDLTERIRIEEQLAASNRRLTDILATATDAIVIMDNEEKIINFNHAAELVFGISASEVIGKPVTILMPEKFREGHHEHVSNFRDQGITARKMGFLGQIFGLRSDGSEFPVEASISQSRDGENIFFTAILRDITERNRIESEIRNLLKEKEIILSEVHHRIKNNLYAISGLLHLQARAAPEDARKILLHAADRVQSMMLLYEKLYKKNRGGNLEIRGFLRSLMEDIIRTFRMETEIIPHLEIEALSFSADKSSVIGIIVMELVNNSIKYAFPERKQGNIRLALNKRDSSLVLEYEDDGVGNQGGETAEHSGFGLNLIRMLTEQLQGKAEISAGPHFQATMTFPAHIFGI